MLSFLVLNALPILLVILMQILVVSLLFLYSNKYIFVSIYINPITLTYLF